MLQVFSMPVGFLEFDSKLFFPDDKVGKQITIPVPSYLITHPKGNVVFDTGVHCTCIEDAKGRLGEVADSFAPRAQPGEEIVSQLAKFSLTPKDITYVANSHFHFDHAGGNEFFPTSTFLVQKNELEASKDPELAEKSFFDPQDYNHPLEYKAIDGEFDIFGDGALVLFPTFGHTPGHQSLRIQVAKGTELVVTADACYTKRNMDENMLPSIAYDTDEMYRSLATLRHMRDRKGSTVIYGHDADQWQQMRHAPESLA